MRDLLASDDPESADLSVGAGIGRSAERELDRSSHPVGLCEDGKRANEQPQPTACGLSEYRPHTGYDRVFLGKWRLVRPLDLHDFAP